jgi:hypothetical protein
VVALVPWAQPAAGSHGRQGGASGTAGGGGEALYRRADFAPKVARHPF